LAGRLTALGGGRGQDLAGAQIPLKCPVSGADPHASAGGQGMLDGVVAGAVSLLLLAQAGSAPIAVPGQGGTYVRVPQGAVDVYIPLDSALRPIVAPGESIPGDWGFLRLAVRPDTALVSIDGRPLGSAGRPPRPPAALALAPGRHRIEIGLTGRPPLAAIVEIVARQTYVLELEVAHDPGPPDPGGGYHVVPRR
jgi:hypothetical protein